MAQYEDEFPARVRVSGHLQTLIRSVEHLRLKVRRSPMLPAHPICIKNQYENNNILGLDTSELRVRGVQTRVDTSELRFGGVQKIILELETRPRTEQFKSHCEISLTAVHHKVGGKEFSRGNTNLVFSQIFPETA